MAFGIDDAIAAGLQIANKFIPDKDGQVKFEAEYRAALLAADTQLAIAQTEVNKIEAASTNLFVSGWRPAIGWICAIAMGYHFIFQPLIAFLAAAGGYKIELPTFDMNSLFTVLAGMLGLGTMRSYEKIKGVTK